jgi:hypothetical protein
MWYYRIIICFLLMFWAITVIIHFSSKWKMNMLLLILSNTGRQFSLNCHSLQQRSILLDPSLSQFLYRYLHIQTLFLFLFLLVCNNFEVNNTINWLYKALFMNWIFKRYFISSSIIEFMNHSEFMTGIVKLHNIEYTLKSH